MWGNLAFKLLGRDQFLKSNEVDSNGFVWTQGVCFAADEGTGEMRFCAANTWVINLIFAQLECCCSKVGNANTRSRMSSHVDYIWMNIFLNDMLQRYSIWFCTNLYICNNLLPQRYNRLSCVIPTRRKAADHWLELWLEPENLRVVFVVFVVFPLFQFRYLMDSHGISVFSFFHSSILLLR